MSLLKYRSRNSDVNVIVLAIIAIWQLGIVGYLPRELLQLFEMLQLSILDFTMFELTDTYE